MFEFGMDQSYSFVIKMLLEVFLWAPLTLTVVHMGHQSVKSVRCQQLHVFTFAFVAIRRNIYDIYIEVEHTNACGISMYIAD